ncbi:Aste57867_20412 [Aphanomyces stellatus]|uniref:Aste57867_20412 protein n=1 Tax=Aphanomyces stellatus TaxID=120398 RepID=A0A485LJM6_9STRA|nr:hypothetical protein As57867_020346 [Aphanomyces stellatus]VFT97098.1 Aste57867_20412 [Aphanomyces stellatus]
MASLVRAAFGPMGAETLLFCPPEPPILTSSGYTIFHYADMTKAHNAHPIKTFLMQKIRAVYREVGDGTTQYILLVDLILQHIDCPSHTWSTAFASLNAELKPMWDTTFAHLAIAAPIAFDATTRLPSHELRAATRNILHTALTGVFAATVVDYLVDITADWFFRTIAWSSKALPRTAADVLVFVQAMLAKDEILSLAMGALDGSRVASPNEYFLRLASHTNLTLRDEPLAMGQRFVLFQGSLELGDATNNVELKVASTAMYLSSLDWSAQVVGDFLDTLKIDHRVNLILCTQGAPDHVVATCVRLGMVCVPFVEVDDVMALAARTGVSWLTSVYDPIVSSLHVGTNGGRLRSVRLGGVAFLHMDALGRSQPQDLDRVVAVPQLLLRGHSKGLCKQYYLAVKKSLRVLQFWCSQDDADATHLRQLGGGQAPERYFAHVLARRKDRAASVMAKALMETCSLLHTNLMTSTTSSSTTTTQRRLEAQSFLDEHRFLGYVLESDAPLRTHAGPYDRHTWCNLLKLKSPTA